MQEGKKVAVFFSVIGAKTYALLKSLVSPDQPSKKKYSELISALTTHLSPFKFKFHQRNQHAHESVSEYAAELRRLSDTCKFGAFLKEALRDKFVCGLQSRVIQKRLLSEADLTFDKALDHALALELADKNTREMKGEAVGESEVKKVSGGYTGFSSRGTPKKREQQSRFSNSRERRVCYRCGKGEHIPAMCRYKSYKCNNCGKVGRLAAKCRNKSAKYVASESSMDDNGEVNEMHTLG